MTKRNAITVSVVFHSVLLTLLAFYLTVWDRPPMPPPPPLAKEDGEITVARFPDPEQPTVEETDPPPPIRDTAANDPPPDVGRLPMEGNDSTELSGPISEASLINPPAPVPTKRVQPIYPNGAIQDGVSGRVEAVLTVDDDGRVIDVEIVESTPRGYFERAAEKALRKWRYAPQLITDVSTVSERQVRVEITFDLEDAKHGR